jgi:hypothetical protein
MFEYARICPDDRASNAFMGTPALCTMLTLTPICKIPKKDGRVGNKWPKLQEAYQYIFGEQFPNAHNAMVDIEATRRVFNWCVREGLFDAEFAKHGYERPNVPEDLLSADPAAIKEAA